MKMLMTKTALLAAVTLVPLLSTQAAYAQRYHSAPWSYDARGNSRVTDHRSAEDQRIIDEITRNDESAGK